MPTIDVATDAVGAAIPNSYRVAPDIYEQRIKPTGTLIKNAAQIEFIAANIVLPHPNKNPFIQNTIGTRR